MSIKDTVVRAIRGGKNANGAQPAEREPAPDALTLIKHDHHEVSELFKTALDDGAKPAEKRDAIRQILEKLTLHADMEEAIFYPALRKAGGEKEKDSVLEAFEEHDVVKELMAKIERTASGDESLEAKVTVLKEIVEHHVEEEESEMFGEARKSLGKERLQQLGEEMQAFKERNGPGGGGRRRRARRAPSRGTKVSARTATAKKSPTGRTTAKKTSTRAAAAKKSPARGAAAKKKAGSTRKR